MSQNYFNDFFGGIFQSINTKPYQEQLDKLYWTNPTEYLRYLQKVKNAGYKVLRNNMGKHKVQPLL